MEIKITEVIAKIKDTDMSLFKVIVNCTGCNSEMSVAMPEEIYNDAQKYETEIFCKNCCIEKRKLPKKEHKKMLDDSYYFVTYQPAENHKGNKPCDYKKYLMSPHWKETRKQAVEKAGGRCQLCNKPSSLHVHHRTYENIGQESMDDLIALCGYCHAKFHDMLD